MAELCGRGLPRRIEPSFCRFLILQFLGLGLGGVKCCVVSLCRLTSTSSKGLRPKPKGRGSLVQGLCVGTEMASSMVRMNTGWSLCYIAHRRLER
jgi:hypothetical protein